MPPIQLPYLPFNSFKESRTLAKSVARQLKNACSGVAAVGSSRLFKVPQLSSKWLYIFEFCWETGKIILD